MKAAQNVKSRVKYNCCRIRDETQPMAFDGSDFIPYIYCYLYVHPRVYPSFTLKTSNPQNVPSIIVPLAERANFWPNPSSFAVGPPRRVHHSVVGETFLMVPISLSQGFIA